MGTILIILGIIILCSKNNNKAKRRHRSYFGKSDWEKHAMTEESFLVGKQKILSQYFNNTICTFY